MSGVDEDLLLRSEQRGSKNTGKVRKFPMHYASRIAAACLCFVVAGVLYVTMNSTKMADSTSADTAGNECAVPEAAYQAAQEENEAAAAEQYAAARAEEAGNDAGMDNDAMSGAAMSEEDAAELPEGAMAEAKQDSQMSADTQGDDGMAESSVEASDDEMQEEEVIEKQGRHLPGKMTRKGL